MQYLSLKKYLSSSGFCFAIFFGCVLLCSIMGFTTELDKAIIIGIPTTIATLVFGLPAIYYLVMYFVNKKKSVNAEQKEGVVVNWDKGFFRYTGCIIVKENDKEYSSPSIFTYGEARALVGKTIIYSIIDEVLFIYMVND